MDADRVAWFMRPSSPANAKPFFCVMLDGGLLIVCRPVTRDCVKNTPAQFTPRLLVPGVNVHRFAVPYIQCIFFIGNHSPVMVPFQTELAP